jgi:hypothetical protein
MSRIRLFFLGTVILFLFLGFSAWKKRNQGNKDIAAAENIVEIPVLALKEFPQEKVKAVQEGVLSHSLVPESLSEVNCIDRLFALDSSKLPIVETISFTSRVPWLKGRPAWISDYASFYETSRHFIARSLNRKPDYFSQKVVPGSRFNVFKKDVNLRFHLLIDLSKCKLWFYYLDLDNNERVLLKTYRVGLGRVESSRKSGYLTPIGKYELGGRVAIYKPGTTGFFQDQKIEMIRVFGTRWIPFEKELEGCSEDPKGYGLHGTPWMNDPSSGQLVEDVSKIGKYDSDGCVRLVSSDMEEIFSIVLTKPTTVELVKDYSDAKLPGIEKTY